MASAQASFRLIVVGTSLGIGCVLVALASHVQGLAHSATIGTVFYVDPPSRILTSGYLRIRAGQTAEARVTARNWTVVREQYRVIAYLNQRQAFVGRIYRVNPGRGVTITVNVTVTSPGVQQLRCVLYAGSGNTAENWQPYRTLRWWLAVQSGDAAKARLGGRRIDAIAKRR